MSWKRPPPRPAKQIGGSAPAREPVRARMTERADVVSVTTLDGVEIPCRQRDPIVTRGNRIRASARGKECQVRYVGICSHDPTRTIWSHARWGAQLGEGGRGMGTKADDLAGAYACTACDAAFDQMTNAADYTREALDLDWLLGHLRSLGILQRDGIL